MTKSQNLPSNVSETKSIPTAIIQSPHNMAQQTPVNITQDSPASESVFEQAALQVRQLQSDTACAVGTTDATSAQSRIGTSQGRSSMAVAEDDKTLYCTNVSPSKSIQTHKRAKTSSKLTCTPRRSKSRDAPKPLNVSKALRSQTLYSLQPGESLEVNPGKQKAASYSLTSIDKTQAPRIASDNSISVANGGSVQNYSVEMKDNFCKLLARKRARDAASMEEEVMVPNKSGRVTTVSNKASSNQQGQKRKRDTAETRATISTLEERRDGTNDKDQLAKARNEKAKKLATKRKEAANRRMRKKAQGLLKFFDPPSPRLPTPKEESDEELKELERKVTMRMAAYLGVDPKTGEPLKKESKLPKNESKDNKKEGIKNL